MAKQNKELDAKIIGDDLSKLATLLSDYEICNDVSGLISAGRICAKNSTEQTWGYKFDFLDFKPDVVGGCLPKDLLEVNLRFSIEIKGLILDENQIKNPLIKLQFDLQLHGVALDFDNDKEVDVFAAWHLDKHIWEIGDNENKYSHPEYHLTFGGNKMIEARNKANQLYDYGASLIMPSPRIAYPPMDAVLGIDFIVQNYINKVLRRNLVSDPEYKAIVKRSQLALWKPYYTSIVSAWYNFDGVDIDQNYTVEKLMPFISTAKK